MEPITLITAAITLATPYLLKTGESIAESIGEEIWKLIKKPFTNDIETQFTIDIESKEGKDKLTTLLFAETNKDPLFKAELETAVDKGQKALNALYQQNVKNYGTVEKQVNIQTNSGNINF